MKIDWLNILNSCLPFAWFFCGLWLANATPAIAGDPFGLTGHWAYRESGGDTGSLSIFDQSYTLNYNKELSQFVALNGAIRYNEYHPSVGAKTDSINPSLSIDLRNDLFFLNLGASGTQHQQENAPTIKTDELGGTFFTLSKDWPLLRLFFSRSAQYDDRKPHLDDTESLTLGGSVDYDLGDFGVLYDFRDAKTDNNIDGSTSENIDHLVQLNYTRNLFQNRLSIAASQQYQNNETISEIRPSVGGDFLLPVTLLAAFSGTDDTPAFGRFPRNSNLIDGDKVNSAGVDIATSTLAQNIVGQIDFQPVSRVRIFLDQHLTPALQGLLHWEVWQSIDGTTWSQIGAALPAVYQLESARTVVNVDLLVPISNRFLKVVSRISLASAVPVFVTEMEMGEIQTSTASRVSIRSRLISHQTEFNAIYRPDEAWQASYNMRFYHSDQERAADSSQLNHAVNVDYFPTESMSFSFGISESLDQVDGVEDRQTHSYSAAVSSALLPTLTLSLGYTRVETDSPETISSDSDNINAVVNAIFYPDLTASLSNNWSRTKNQDGREVTSYGVTLNTYAKVTPGFDLNLIASYIESTNTGQGEIQEIDDQGTRYALNANYRPSDILLLSGSVSQDMEEDQTFVSAAATILLTRKIQTLFGTSLAYGADETQQYNTSVSWSLNRQISLQLNGDFLVAEEGDSWSILSTANANF